MKKLLIIAVAMLALSSCKKIYSCSCTINGPGVNETASENYGKMKKKDAEKKCDEGDETAISNGETYVTACSIK